MNTSNLTHDDRDVKEAKFCSGFGQYHTANPEKENPKPYIPLTFYEVIESLGDPESVPKERGAWGLFSTEIGPRARNHKYQEENGLFLAAWADLDDVPGWDFSEIVNTAQGIIPADLFAYTSVSATPDKPKCRIIALYAQPIQGELHVIVQRIFNKKLKAVELPPDKATERAGQLCYLPNTLGDFYEYFPYIPLFGGFDPLTVWADEIQTERYRIQAEEEERKAKQEQARLKAAQRVADGIHSPVDAYNSAYALPMMLEGFGYTRHRDRYLTPNSESGNPGVTISDDGRKWFSAHESDADIGRPTNNGTMGDAFDLFVYYQHEGDYDAAVKAAGEMFAVNGVTLTKANQREFMERRNKVTADDFDFGSDENPLSKFTLNGESEAMKKQMLDDVAILGNLALFGQWTMLYSKPNAGKTLLTIWLLIAAIKAGILKGTDVYYINADDTHKGLTYKLKLAEDNDFMMLAPGYKDFKVKMLKVILKKLIEGGSAKGKVLILDTIKKFTDIMKKDKSSEYGEGIRQFILQGGSVIALAHVNKHRGDDGKVIHAGTSDLVDDCDCAYTLDIVKDDKWEGERIVKFENFKNRGDVALEASYSYDAGENRTYQERLDSIECLDKSEVERAELYRKREKLFLNDKDIIDDIKEILSEKPMNKKELIKAVIDESGVGRDRIRRILKDHHGACIDNFQFWLSKKSGNKNERIYTLNEEDIDVFEKPAF